MKVSYATYITLCLFTAQTMSNEECVYIRTDESIFSEELDCKKTSVCRQNFSISILSIPPFSEMHLLERVISQCCGKCLSGYQIITSHLPFDNKTINVTMRDIRKESDSIFPCLASANAIKLFGWYYIPLVQVPSFFYITPKEVKLLTNLISSALELYPLVIICLALAIISGFIMWLLETWRNEKEFHRPFFVGWFDGFWWSFVSMTTVGYGDKIPSRRLAQFFSVIWILMGISLFDILTAEITSILVEANNPPAPTVQGKLVGVLKYREYDKSYVAKNGGLVYQTKDKNKSENFSSDIHNLITNLRKGVIHGILLDKTTMAYTMEYLRNKSSLLDKEQEENAQFMLYDTLQSEKVYAGNKMAYGIIFKKEEHKNFFGSAIRDNHLAFMSEKELGCNRRDDSVKSKKNLFNPNGHLFLTGVKVTVCIIGLIILFGILFEAKRKGIKVPMMNKSGKLEFAQRQPLDNV